MLSFHTALIMIRRARVSATRKPFFSPDSTAANCGSCPVLSLSSSAPLSTSSARSSPPNMVLRPARFGHTSCWTTGIHAYPQWRPAAPAGVVNVTASSTGPMWAKESACTSMPRTCAMNDVMSRLAVESSANWNRRIAASSRSLAVRPSAVLNNAARCQTGARPVAFHATDSA